MYVNDGDVPSLHSRGVLEERELFHGIPELTLTLPKIQKKKLVSGFNIEFQVSATTYCQRFADSAYTRTHTHTPQHVHSHIYVCIFRNHEKKLRRDKIQQKLVGSTCSACGPQTKSHYKRWRGATQGSSPDGRDANLSPLTRLHLSRNSRNAQMS